MSDNRFILCHKATGAGVFLGKRHSVFLQASATAQAQIEQLFDYVTAKGLGDLDDFVILGETDPSWSYGEKVDGMEWVFEVKMKEAQA